ncbi:MAG: hypothetical protein RL224_358, partial [Actinomycetota bacterium]
GTAISSKALSPNTVAPARRTSLSADTFPLIVMKEDY